MSYKLLTNLLFEPRGKHNPSLTYNIKDTVMSEDGSKVYFALDNVPAGIPLTDTNYWMLQMDLSASKNAMDVAAANARTQTDATIASANTRVEDMMGKAAEAVTSVADYATKLGMRVKGETRITKGNPMTIYPDGGSLLKVQTDIPIKQLGKGDPYPAGSGKNKFTGWIRGEKINSITGAIENTSNAARTGYIPVVPSKQIEISGLTDTLYHFVVYYDEEKNFINRSVAVGLNAVTIRTPDNCAYIAITQYENVNVTGTIADLKDTVQIEYGVSVTEYEPWENIRPFVGYDELELRHSGKNLCDISPFLSAWATENTATLSLINKLSPGTYTISVVFEMQNPERASATNKYGLFLYPYGERVFAEWGSVAVGTTRRMTYTFNVTADNAGKFTAAYFYGCGEDGIGYTGYATTKNVQIEFGSTATPYEPYKGSIHTVQLDKTTYQGHYDWLTGKFKAEWKRMRLLSSYVSSSMKYVSGYVGAWMDKVLVDDHSEGPETILCSHLLGRNVYNWSRDGVYVQDENTIGIQFSGSSIPGYTDTGNADQNAGLVRAYLDANDVQIVYKLATPIEIQLAPNVITAVEDGGVNHIYGDADLTVEWVKPLETSLTEHGNAKVDANNEALLMDVAQKERSIGNPVVINDAVANVAFPNVETVFTPKQEGSGDPYPAGGGKNLCNPDEFTQGDLSEGRYLTNSVDTNNVSGYVPVSPNTTYTRSSNCVPGSREIAFFDADKNYLSRAFSDTFTTPDGCYFVRLEWEATYPLAECWFQLELGSVATEYATYSNIRPITGYDAVVLNHAGKNLLNNIRYYDSTHTDIRAQYDSPLLLKAGVKYVLSTNFKADGLFFGDAAGNGSLEAQYLLNYQYQTSALEYTPTRDIECLFVAIFNSGVPVGTTIQLEVGSATAYEPYQGNNYTVQIGETVYGGHYNWLTGKLTKNVGNITLDGSQGVISNWFGEHGNMIVAYSVPDALAISPAVKSNLLISDKLKTEIGDDQHLFESGINSISMSGSSGCIVVCIRGITTLEGVHAWLSQNPVECIYPLATPIEIQLDPTRITTIPGTNTIFGDGEFTIDWFKSYKKVAEERENLLLDSFTDKAELSGNPIVISPVGGLPFDSVVTEFSPKQAGSGDPYPAGGGKNMWDNAAMSLGPLGNTRTETGFKFVRGTGSGASYVYYRHPVHAGETVTFSAKFDNYIMQMYIYETGVYGTQLAYSGDGKVTYTANADYPNATFAITIGSAHGDCTVSDIQIEFGTEVTAYQPYTNIRPITGYDKLELGTHGKNIFPAWAESSYTMNGVTFTKQADGSIRAQGTPSAYAYITLTDYKTLKEHGFAEGVHIFSGLPEASNAWFVDLIGDANTQNIDFYQNGSFNLSFEVKGNGTYAWRIVITPNMGAVDLIFKPQVEFGSTATPYEPHQGTIHTVQIGQTVYGGKFDWLTGKGVIEWAMQIFNGTEEWAETIEGNIKYIYYSPTEKPQDGYVVCSHMPFVYDYQGNGMYCHNKLIIVGAGMYSRYGTIAKWKEFLAAEYAAGTPIQVAYKLATPIEIQLTPTEIIALTGVNTLYGDGDTITAKFRQSKDVDILKRLSALETLMTNQTKGE